MSTKGNPRPSRTARRRKSSLKPKARRRVASKLRSGKAEEKILAFVRSGVERFILKNATVEDFFNTIRAVTEKEKVYSHRLSRAVFSRIVREAIRKRNVRRSK